MREVVVNLDWLCALAAGRRVGPAAALVADAPLSS